MRKLVFALCLLGLSAGQASAAGVGQVLQGLAGDDSVGSLISGEIYGNTSNPSGNGNGVLPSLSPGPWACTDSSDCSGPTSPGGSMGEFIAPLVSGHASPNFANGKTPGPDFSGN
jgi:hypothetical protein